MSQDKITLEYRVENRVYRFVANKDYPIGEIYDALTAMKDYLLKHMQSLDACENSCNSCEEDCDE